MIELDEIRLKEWEEIIGIFKGVEKDNFRVSVLFGDLKLIFNLESPETKILKETLDGVMIGNKISILKTDISEKPIFVRVDKTGQDTPSPLILLHKGKTMFKDFMDLVTEHPGMMERFKKHLEPKKD